MSLLEWMMTKIPFYGRIPQDEEDELGDYNPKIITKLLKNYRSHPSILEVRYYDKNQGWMWKILSLNFPSVNAHAQFMNMPIQ